MATPDDISDMFDDDLTRSIVDGQKGPWGEDQPGFVDPALKAIEQELAGNKQRDYRERRLEELQRRGEDQPKAAPARRRAPVTRAPAAPAASLTGLVWGAGDFAEPADPLAPPTAEDVLTQLPTDPAGAAGNVGLEPDNLPVRSPLVPFAIAVANATLVIAVAAAAHALMTGWSALLFGRALVAGVVSGLLWQQLRTGRLRATAIAACVYVAAFLPSEQLGRLEHILALFLGLFAVVAGAALLGDRSRRF